MGALNGPEPLVQPHEDDEPDEETDDVLEMVAVETIVLEPLANTRQPVLVPVCCAPGSWRWWYIADWCCWCWLDGQQWMRPPPQLATSEPLDEAVVVVVAVPWPESDEPHESKWCELVSFFR